MRSKIRHKRAAHRLYMRLWLSNCTFFDDPVNTNLKEMLYLLCEVCYTAKHPSITSRDIKTTVRDFRRYSESLLRQRGLSLRTVRAWNKLHTRDIFS